MGNLSTFVRLQGCRFISAFALDSRKFIYCSVNVAYSVNSNLMTPVDEAFFRIMEYEKLCSSTLSLNLQKALLIFFFSFPMCFHEMISNLFYGSFMQLAHNNQELACRGMEICSHELVRL